VPTSRKVLGQSRPAATTETALYTVPVGGSAVISTITIANDGAATTFRVRIAVNGAATAASQDLFPTGTAIGAAQLVAFTAGLTLAAGDIVRVYATLATLTFQLFGEETT
jgi:hypothetical protein